MRRKIKIVLTILTVSLLTGCDFIKNAFTYEDKTKNLIETILKEDYNKAIDHFAMEHEMAKNTDIEAMKKGLANFRERIVNNFGSELDYSFMKAEKTWSTEEGESTPQNTTVALIEFSNGKEFGVFKVLFDDISGKILNINTLDVKQPIPHMIQFWLFGLLAICIPIFNIYVIRQIRKSNFKRKWVKYLAIAVLNVPAITYAAVNGISLEYLNFQILFGISFSYLGYLNSTWTFGLPLGGLYWFWKLKQKKSEVTENITSTESKIDTVPTNDTSNLRTES